MKTLTKLAATAIGCLALLSGWARANFIPIAQPDAAYLSATALLGFAAPDFGVVGSLTDGTQTATFDIAMVALTVPTTWSSWGSPPNTESATPRVLWTNGFTSLQISLGTPTFTFGFEAQPNTQVVSNLTVDFFSLGLLVGTIALDVDGNAGALLFAAKTNQFGFDMIVINGFDDFAIANVRYDPFAVPEPSSAALLLLGGGLMVLLRRRGRAPNVR
jgi:hypothetical protein